MSREDFTRYVEQRGFHVREFFYPAGMLTDPDGNPVPDEDFTVVSLVKFDGPVLASGDVSDAMFDQGPPAWDMLIQFTEEELDRQRAKLATSDRPG